MFKPATFALLIGGTILPSQAIAQTSLRPDSSRVGPAADPQVNGSGDIIVTAQKRAENLQDVPISITALSAATLAAKGINGLQDFVAVPPPGLFVQSFAGANQILVLDIRGISNPDPGQGTVELGTAIYLDDIYLGRAQGLGSDLADPERIEVLRGPQGTLFGRNAEGGAVRIVSKKPTGIFGGRAKVSIGDYGRRRYEAHLDLPEVAGFSVKLDYLNSNIDGYTRNGTTRVAGLASQDTFGSEKSEGYRGSVRWRPVSNLTVDYAYDYAKAKYVGDWNVLVAPSPAVATFTLPSTFLNRARPAESISARTDTSYAAMFNEPFVVRTFGHTLTAAYDVSSTITVKSLTAWRGTNSDGSQQLGGAFSLVPFEFTPGILRPLPAASFAPDPRFGTLGTVTNPSTLIYAVTGVVPYARLSQRQFSQEVQVIGSTDTVEYVLGGYYFREQITDRRQTFFSGMFLDTGTDGAFTNFVGTNPFSLPFPGQGATSQNAASRSFAAFAQATWSPTFADGKLHITGGLRYTNDYKEAQRTLQGGGAVNVQRTFKASRVDPALTVAYEVAEDANVYFRYAQAYRAGGASIRDPNFTAFGAEVNKAYELGFKSRLFDRAVTFNAAAFYNQVQNRQITVQINPVDPAQTRTINAPGTAPVYGLELELTAKPVRNLTLGATYTYQQGELDLNALAAIDTVGNFYIPNLPAHSGSFTVDYVSDPLGFGTIALHGDYSWSEKWNGTIRVPKTSFAHMIKRDVANVRVSLQDIPVGPAGLTLSVFAKNLFDTAYPVFVSSGANAILSPPRTYGVELGLKF
jgi:iron complex outermembrane recepter protein